MPLCYRLSPFSSVPLCVAFGLALLGLCLSLSAPAAAQSSLRVGLPDLTARSPGTTLTVPVRLETPVETSDDVASYSLELSYDPDVVTVTGIDDAGTLTEGWTATPNSPSAGTFLVNAIIDDVTADPITGSVGDVVVNLVVDVDAGGGSSPLTLDDADLGEATTVGIGGFVSAGNALVFTELHTAPASGPTGDANGDGTTDTGDRFVEIVNTGTAPASLDGFVLVVDGTDRFSFPDVTIAPGDATVVFSGGTPTNIPGADFVAAGGLQLGADGGTVALRGAGGALVDGATYGPEADNGQSVARFPEFTGPFDLHTVSTTALYSPGRSLSGDPLPVELGAFTVTRDGRDAVLQWTTLSETGNRGFVVEHAPQGSPGAFAEVAFVRGAGSSTSVQQYAHRVRDLAPGLHAFRLKQVDLDGTATYSASRTVRVPLDGAFELAPAAPNPFRNAATLTLQVRDAQPVTVALFNVLGQRVQTLFDGTMAPGTPYDLTVRGEGLPSGLYVYRVTGASFRTTGRLVRVR